MQTKGTERVIILVEEASYLRDTGTVNAFEVRYNVDITEYTNGLNVKFMAKRTNTGPVTLSVNGLPAVPIVKNVDQPLQKKDIRAHQIVECTFDGTNFQMERFFVNAMAITSLRV